MDLKDLGVEAKINNRSSRPKRSSGSNRPILRIEKNGLNVLNHLNDLNEEESVWSNPLS